MTLDEYLRCAVFYRPRPFSQEEFRAFMLAQSRPFPETIDAGPRPGADRAYRLMTLNNESAELNQHRIERVRPARHLHDVLLVLLGGDSQAVRRIYEVALAMSQSDPAASVFIDDREQNLAAGFRPRDADHSFHRRCPTAPGAGGPGRAHLIGGHSMQLAMIGLGRMGGNMVQRLLQGGHEVVVFDRSADVVQQHVAMGATAAKDLADVCRQLAAPRVVWIMVPAGAPVESTIDAAVPALSKGDIIIDGGNSNFHDSHAPRGRAPGAGARVHRRRHERRHLGARDRLLPDGRGLGRGLPAVRADLHDARAGGRLRARRPAGRRPLREDGPQRHRVRHAPGVRRGLRDPARVEGLSSSTSSRSRRSGTTAASSAPGSTSWPSAPSRRTRTWRHSRATSPTPARAAGRCRRRSTSTCRRR